ncbi:MAG: ABC transporter ATP-binding protein [candidate division Zixibacteria bacterium]|nr:ABC transporter ATP-binding protein [candidate division Zixibacteria bacterium]
MPFPLLQIENATTMTFGGGLLSGAPAVVALEGFNLDLHEHPARITAIAGESGSGKTTLAHLVLGFLHPTRGRILYRGVNLADMDRTERLAYRKDVQAIFQDPYEVFNPFFRVHHTFDLVTRCFLKTESRTETRAAVEEALRRVGLRGEEILEKYPHQLSGGQRQRVMMARAALVQPRLIVTDEPVSAVDASLRASILDLMRRMRDENGISFLYITHDLSTAYQIGDRMAGLFRGVTVEEGDARALIEQPRHPYVRELIGSIPVPDPKTRWNTTVELPADEDRVRSASGCRYYSRCAQRMDVCLSVSPRLVPVAPDHAVACHLYVDNLGVNGRPIPFSSKDTL